MADNRSSSNNAKDLVPSDVIPPGDLPPLEYRELPPPVPFRKMIGPSVILAGLSLGSGEFIIWPYITYQSQFVFFWACVLGVTTQYFINMEIARWTLATGESAITGFVRLSKYWAGVFLIANIVPHMIPAWGTGAAQLVTWLIWPPERVVDATEQMQFASAGSAYVPWFAIAGLVFCGVLLTAGPVVYKTIERTQMFLVSLVLALVIVITVMVVRPDAVMAQLSATATLGAPQFIPLGDDFAGLDAAMLLGALAFAGCGGTLNLGQSNYVKDKGFGMGRHVGRITSPITGQEESISETGYHFRHTEENMARWRVWWKLACREHFLSFYLTCLFCLVTLTLICYSLCYTPEGTYQEGALGFGKGLLFVFGESMQLEAATGVVGRQLFLLMGIAILFTTELAVLDAVSRVATDVVKVSWLRENKQWSESRLYCLFLWGEILLGVGILLYSHDKVADDTLKNFKIVSALNGGIMGVYSATLLWLNCRFLPRPLRMSWPRILVMLWSVGFFGFFAVWALWNVLLKG